MAGRPGPKSYVGDVPVFRPRGGVVHIVIGGIEVSAMPIDTFCTTADNAKVLADRLRSGRNKPVPLRRAGA